LLDGQFAKNRRFLRQVITEDLGLKLENTELEQLGRAHKVIATKEHTTIVDGQGEKSAIDARVSQIKAEFQESNSDFDKEKLQERMARLAGGVGVIKVGAFTETEMKAKKFKIEDALNATRAAVEEGIIAGGGAALARMAPELDKQAKNLKGKVSDAELAGYNVIRKSLEEPLRQIARNSGVEVTGILHDIQESKLGSHHGFDFANYDDSNWKEGMGNLIEKGIVDPLKVTRLALENAVSIASTLVTTEAIIVDKPEPKQPTGAPGMGGMGGMGMGGMDY
jgi:chaperonin GroEL